MTSDEELEEERFDMQSSLYADGSRTVRDGLQSPRRDLRVLSAGRNERYVQSE